MSQYRRLKHGANQVKFIVRICEIIYAFSFKDYLHNYSKYLIAQVLVIDEIFCLSYIFSASFLLSFISLIACSTIFWCMILIVMRINVVHDSAEVTAG